MSEMNISGSSGSTAGVQNHSSETQRSHGTGALSQNLQSVKNKAEQKSEALSRTSSISCLPKGQPNTEASKSIKVPQGRGGKAQISQTGVYTLDAGNSGASTSLKINVPAKHVGDPLVTYYPAKMGNDETFVRTLDRKERMALVADSKEDYFSGTKIISAKGIQYGKKIIPWRNVIAWQKPETSTFDKPNNAAKLMLFFREGEGVAVLDGANAHRLDLNVLCHTTETLDSFYPAFLCNESPDLQRIKVSEYVDSLIHEFGTAVPERVILTKLYAKGKDSFGKDKLYHLQSNIDEMCTYSNGKSREALELSHRYRHEQAKAVSEAKKNYAQGIKALSADWSISAETKVNWSDNDTLRCAVIENVIKSGLANRISDADAKKYLPTIYTSKRFNQYINTVYANSDYQIALRSMVDSNDFSGIQGINEVSPRARTENIKSAISNLKTLALLNPKKIRRELKRNEKELLNHLEKNSVLDKDVKTLAYGKEIDKLSNQLNLLKNKAYRKEIASLKMDLKKITEPEPGSMEHMVATSLSRNNVQSKYSEKSIDTLRALRDEKVLGLRGNENKHERECLRQQIAWLDNHIESVVETYYGFLSLKDKVDFLLQESDIAWGKYADYLRKPVDKELVRKYHHMAITRNSQLKYLISAIKKISNGNYIFSPGDIEYISSQNLFMPDIPDGIKFDKKVFRSLEKTRDSFSEFSTWAWYPKYNATHDPVSRNTLRNNKLSGVSIKKNEPLADSDNVEKSLQVKGNVNPKNKDTLRKEIINEIDFKKYNSQIDGEIAVLALYSYLAERNVQLNIFNADKTSLVSIGDEAVGRGLNIKEPSKTDNSVSIILDRSHYSGFDPKKEITYPSKGDGNCLFHSVANMLKINNIKMEGINKIVDGVYLNQLTKEHFNNNFDKFIAAFFNSDDESDTTNGERTKALFRLVKEYKNLPLETVESGATASGDDNSLEFKITFNDEVYTLKNVKALEEMAKKTSDRAEKKQLHEEVKEQKSIYKKLNIPFESVELTKNSMTVTVLEKQKDLLVQVKYFYDSEFKRNEDATEYKPISGAGDLKIPGVNGKIYTIPGCTYKRYERKLGASTNYDYFKQVENAKETHFTHAGFTNYIDDIIAENRFDYFRTMTPSELHDLRKQVELLSQQETIDRSSIKIEDYFQPQMTENNKVPGAHENIISSGNRIPIVNSEIKGLDPRLAIIISRFPDIFEKYKKLIYTNLTLDISKLCELHEREIRDILAENYLELKSGTDAFLGFMEEFLYVAKKIDQGVQYLLKDESTLKIRTLLSSSPDGVDSKGITAIKFKNGFDVPLNELFVRIHYEFSADNNKRENKFDYPAHVDKTNKFMWEDKMEASIGESIIGESRMLLEVDVPSNCIAQRVISDNDIDEVSFGLENITYNATMLKKNGLDKEQFLKLMSEKFKFKNRGPIMVFQDKKYSPDKLSDNSFCDFKMSTDNHDFKKRFDQYFGEKYNKAKELAESKADKKAEHKGAKGAGKIAKDVPTVKSTSSSVNEKVAQEALPQPPQAPSQPLQENAVSKAIISSQETIRRYSSTHLLTSNSNAVTAQNNEHAVEDDQNTGNIKHHDGSVISTDGVRLSQKVKETIKVPSSDLTPEKSLSIGTNLKLSIDNNGKYSFSPDIPKGSVQSIDGLQSWRVSSLQNKDDSVAFMELVYKQFVDGILTSDLKDEILTQALIHYVKTKLNKDINVIYDLGGGSGGMQLDSECINVLRCGSGFQLMEDYELKNGNETDVFKIIARELKSNKAIARELKSNQAIARNSNDEEKIDAMINLLKIEAEHTIRSDAFANLIDEMKVPGDKENSLKSIKVSYEDFISMYRRMLVGPGGLIPDEGLAYRIYNGCLQVARIKDNAITSTSYSLTEGTKPEKLFIPDIVTTNMPIETNGATILNTFLDAKVTPITDPAFVEEHSMEKLISNMLELAKNQRHDRSDILLDDNDPHVSEPSVSDENEAVAVAAQTSNEILTGKASKELFSRRELNRIHSRQSVPVQ